MFGEDEMKEAIVTISLKELDGLRNNISRLEKEVERLKDKKEVTITLDGDIYDHKSGEREFMHRMRAYGSWEVLMDEFKTWQEMQHFLSDMWEKLVEKSVERRFYNKFPRWVHDLFDCK
jgi:hypothetical protein